MNKTPPPLVLAYHALGDVPLTRDWYRLFVRPKDLRRHIERLRAWKYRTVTFGELAAAVAGGGGAGMVALTFDDGFEDNATVLAPLLVDMNVKGTVFVISGRLGQAHHEVPWARMMTETQVRELHDAGIQIGAHTVTHPDLTQLSYEDALTELATSKEQLEDIVSAPVTVAAYPYGAADEKSIRACRDAGFVAACRTSGRGSWDEPLNLPRQDVGNRQSAFAFYLKRDNRYEPVMKPVLPVLATKPARFAIKVIRHYRSAGRA
jgi:peptidoglycan/xylan/chitin deacetylase (PgdA/CDA1 family)